MEYKMIKDSYDLHMIKTTKFKTLFFKIVFTKEIKKDEITIRNMLLDNLIFSCKNYPTKKQMAIKKQDLYGADIYGNNKRVGKNILTEIYLSILNPKYTEEDMLFESLDFLHEIIFNPNVENNKFNEEIFNIIKNNLESDIKSTKENTSLYANQKLKQLMGDYPFSYKMEGTIEDLEKINNENLYTYYKEFLKNNKIDIFVVGDLDFNLMKQVVNEKLCFPSNDYLVKDFAIDYRSENRGIDEVVEESSYNQSKLAIGCSLGKLTKKEKKYVATIYNIILGNSPDSKFFKNIREKKSYAYTINSTFRRMDDILTISAGISYSNYDDVVKSIEKEIDDMRKGKFNDLDIEKAKNLYISVINDINEFQSSISEYYYNLRYLGMDDYNKEIDIIKDITKEEIVDVANKISIDAIYLLKEKEEEHERN